MHRFRFRIPATYGLVLVLTVLSLASSAGGLHGTVFDPTGAVLPHARVELLENGILVASKTSDSTGRYEIAVEPGSNLSLRVSSPGFAPQEKALGSATADGDGDIDFSLALATFSDQVTVVSTGLPTPQAQLGASVTVLDAEDLQGTQEAEERLRHIPGLQTNRVGQAGGSTGLFIRGGGSDANKVLIDGIPINNVGGLVEFGNLSSAAISQIEVLRGPNSALYGSDALAGVVSISTPRGTAQSLFTYAAGGGNFGSYYQDGSVSGSFKKLDYFTDYARFDTRNSIPGSSLHNGTLAGNFGWALTPNSSLRATIHHDQVAAGQPNAILLFGIPSAAKLTSEDAYFGVTWEDKTSPKWNNVLRYGGARLRSDYIQFAPTGIPQYLDSSTYEVCTVATDANCVLVDYLGSHVALTGANGYRVSGQAQYNYPGTYPSYNPSSTDRNSVYAQSDYLFRSGLRGLASFRFEDERGYSYGQTNSIERRNNSYTLEVQGGLAQRLFYMLGQWQYEGVPL